jgi:Rrf2 family protein
MLVKSTQYAIRALVYIQLQNWLNKRPGVVEIAKEIEAPEAYSAKILQTLTKHQLVDSMKGRGGGFFFNGIVKKITLYDVIHVMEGDACFKRCGFGLKLCNQTKPCPLHEKYKTVRDEFLNLANAESIQSIAKKIADGKAYLKSTMINE